MYDVAKALRRFKGLIIWISRKYAVIGNFRLSEQDLEAEGYLVLVKCCRNFPRDGTRFSRYFKKALYNRLKDIAQTERRLKREGVQVDLVEAFGVPSPSPLLVDSLGDQIEVLRPHLSAQAFTFLQQLAEPSTSVIEFAWREFCRRNKLYSQGFQVTGYDKFRVKPRHIRKVFGWTAGECKLFLKDIQKVYITNKDQFHSRRV